MTSYCLKENKLRFSYWITLILYFWIKNKHKFHHCELSSLDLGRKRWETVHALACAWLEILRRLVIMGTGMGILKSSYFITDFDDFFIEGILVEQSFFDEFC